MHDHDWFVYHAAAVLWSGQWVRHGLQIAASYGRVGFWRLQFSRGVVESIEKRQRLREWWREWQELRISHANEWQKVSVRCSHGQSMEFSNGVDAQRETTRTHSPTTGT